MVYAVFCCGGSCSGACPGSVVSPLLSSFPPPAAATFTATKRLPATCSRCVCVSVCLYLMCSLLVQKLPEFSDATIVRSRTPEVKHKQVQPVNLPRAICHEAYRFSPPAPSWLTLAECTIMRRRDTTTIRYADAVAVADDDDDNGCNDISHADSTSTTAGLRPPFPLPCWRRLPLENVFRW